MYTSVR
jgi:hypothetical protein